MLIARMLISKGGKMSKIWLSLIALSFACLGLAEANDKAKFSVSDQAKARKEAFCNGDWKDVNISPKDKRLFSDNQAELKKRFCTRSTFHCTNSKTLFGKNTGVCDATDLCLKPHFERACQVACVDKRAADTKTTAIQTKLNNCVGRDTTEENEAAAAKALPKKPTPPAAAFNERRGLKAQGLPPTPAEIAASKEQAQQLPASNKAKPLPTPDRFAQPPATLPPALPRMDSRATLDAPNPKTTDALRKNKDLPLPPPTTLPPSLPRMESRGSLDAPSNRNIQALREANETFKRVSPYQDLGEDEDEDW